MENIILLFKTVGVFLGLIIVCLGFTPAIVIAAMVAFVVPIVIVEFVLLYILISRFDIKKLFCLIGFSVFSFLDYSTLAFPGSKTGLEAVVDGFFFCSLYGLLAIACFLFFLAIDDKIRAKLRNSAKESDNTNNSEVKVSQEEALTPPSPVKEEQKISSDVSNIANENQNDIGK